MLIDAIIYTDDMKTKVISNIYVKDQEFTPVQLALEGKPALIILNYGDHTYTKVRFDPLSLTTLKTLQIAKIEDPLTRTLVWRNLLLHVLDLKLSSIEFYSILQNNMLQETNTENIAFLTQASYGLLSKYLPVSAQEAAYENIFTLFLQMAA
jgi:aminopeptidase N